MDIRIETTTDRQERDNFFDILKGIGIISVVLGHALCDYYFSEPIQVAVLRFVYIYHLAVFFFVSGYFFHFKPIDSPLVFLKRLINNLYLPWILWGCFFTVLDIFRGCSPEMLLNEIIKCVLMRAHFNSFSGAMWFVPWLILTQMILYCVLYFARNSNKILKGLLLLSCPVIGMIFVAIHFGLCNIDLSFVMVAVMVGGHIYRNNRSQIDRFITSWHFIPMAVVIICINAISGLQIEFSARMLYGYVGLFPMMLLGIWFCISLAKCLGKSKLISLVFAMCGQHSYAIMALHFLIFSIIDRGYLVFRGLLGKELVALLYPYTFPELRIVYVVLGVSLPIMVSYLFKKIALLMR